MADKDEQQIWPLPAFYFEVEIPGVADRILFQEVSGLENDAEVLEYRAGDSRAFSTFRLPGMKKSGNVTLKKGVFAGDNAFWDWIRDAQMNTITRHTVTIRLLDQAGGTSMAWTLANAFPVKFSSADLAASGTDIRIETVELAFDTITIQNG